MEARSPFWLADDPLILASGSATRRDLLLAAGLCPEIIPAEIDERALEAGFAKRNDAKALARRLAEEKALAVSRLRPGRWVLGADQTLAIDDKILHKAKTRDEATARLTMLSGRAHALHGGLALARSGDIAWSHVETAHLSVRVLSPGFIAAYLVKMGPAAFTSVGVYQYEGIGVQLFERIEGDQPTILGLPLLPLLAEFRRLSLVLT